MEGLALDLPRPQSLRSAKVEEGFPLQAQRVAPSLLDLPDLPDGLPGCGEISGRRTSYPSTLLSPLEVKEVEEVEERGFKPLGLQHFSLLDLADAPGLEVEEVERFRAAIAARRDRWLLGAILGA